MPPFRICKSRQFLEFPVATVLFGSAASNLITVSGLAKVTDQTRFPLETTWCTADGFYITAFGQDLSLDATGTYHGTAEDIRITDSAGNLLLVMRGVHLPLLPLTSGFDTTNFLGGDDSIVGSDNGEAIYGMGGNDVVDGRGGDDTIYGGDGHDHIGGNGGNDTLFGGNGDDTVVGGVGDDNLSGDAGNDTILGDDGNDVADGGDGDDTIYGGNGDDHIGGNGGNDTLYGGYGNDTVVGGAGDDWLYGNAGNDALLGDDGDDIVFGGGGADRLEGGNGNDDLYGGNGKDIIFGGDGVDFITGGLGRDILTGGACTDYFNYDALAEVGVGATRDLITDFEQGVDKIGLADIDANIYAVGNQAFRFRGYGEVITPGEAGKLKFYFVDLAGTDNDRTIVHGDVNGDGKDDLQIELCGLIHLTKDDFIL